MGVSDKKKRMAPLSEEERMLAAWENARPTTDDYERIDCDGSLMVWDQYGKNSNYGWVIEYVEPLGEGGRENPPICAPAIGAGTAAQADSWDR